MNHLKYGDFSSKIVIVILKRRIILLTVSDVSLRFSDRKLFDEVNIKFTAGNTYGLIGANGAEINMFKNISWRY